MTLLKSDLVRNFGIGFAVATAGLVATNPIFFHSITAFIS
jgi:hypothetical protein